jgi:glutamate 5-kinase
MSVVASARRLVIKIGSSLLIDEVSGAADRTWLGGLGADLARLSGRGQKVVVVSSGAVALGRSRLGFGKRALTLAEKQAAAAAGQSLLMRVWEEALEPRGLTTAQILLTPDDTEVRRRFLNARATLGALLNLGAVPVVNENDTVATEELRYGDNDRLAARVAQMVGADLLILLSDVDGLYTADPAIDPLARHMPRLAAITPDVEAMAGGAATVGVGTGGMRTKLAAARIAASAGCATLIALGRRPSPLAALEHGAAHTLIDAVGAPAAAYKAWIAGTLTPQGSIAVDDGAVRALRGGGSLLCAGVRAVDGRFGKGDAVVVTDLAGREIARGLSRYDADDARAAAGLRSADIETLLGGAPGPLIHADDLAVDRRHAADA